MIKSITRRQFLRSQLTGALWMTAAASGLGLPRSLFAAEMPDLAVAQGTPAAATRAAVDLLGGMGAFVKPGSRVVIKPNMSFTSPPERASNTHPEVVREIAALCKQAGAGEVRVLDNPLGRAERCLEMSGIEAACKPIDERMVQTVQKESQYRQKPIPDAVALSETDVMKAVLEADVLIAAPVAKSHSGAGVSLSMKGMMGLVYNRRIMHFLDLNEAIVDLASLLRPQLVIIDATRVLSTGGPGGPGKVLTPNTVIASRDMVAADAYAVSSFEWYGKRYQPGQVAHIRKAHERGLGRMDVENLRIRTVTV